MTRTWWTAGAVVVAVTMSGMLAVPATAEPVQGAEGAAPVAATGTARALAGRELPAGVTPTPVARDASRPAEAPVPTGRLLVRRDAGTSAAQAERALTRRGLDVAATSDQLAALGWAVVTSPDGSTANEERAASGVAGVLDVVPELQRRASFVPSEPFFPDNRIYFDQVRLPEAWDRSRGSGAVVAVLDTGVRANHEELAGSVLSGRSFVPGVVSTNDDGGHGTLVAGVVAARGNGRGLVGAAFQAQVIPVKVLDSSGNGTDAGVAEGIMYAADRGADVINLSLGGPGESAVLEDALEYAVDLGSVVVVSAGNDGTEEPQYPAGYASTVPGVIAVGATDDQGYLTRFSSWGDHVSVVAPGVQIVGPSFASSTAYESGSGTSFSAPLVSGVAAMVARSNPAWTPAQVADRIRATARDAGPLGADPYYGHGVLDAAAALGRGPAVPFDRLPSDAGAADDDPGSARALPRSGSTGSARATVSPEGDQDWTSYTAATDGWYEVTVTPDVPADGDVYTSTFDPVLQLRDGDDGLIGERDDNPAFEPESSLVAVEAGGTLRVGVRNYDASAGPWAYSVQVRLASAQAVTAAPEQAAWVSSSATPAHAVGLSVRPTLSVQLGRDVDPDSLSGGVRLQDGAGRAVPVQTALSGRTLSVTPLVDLAAGGHHQLRLLGLVDLEGEVMDLAWRLPFTVLAGGDRFTPVTPVRLVDTRKTGRALVPTSRLDVALAGVSVPADTTAVVLNVTAVAPTTSGHVQVFPRPTSGDVRPTVSNINVVEGVDQPNLVTTRLGAGGAVRITTGQTTAHVLVDLAGWYTPGGATAYEPLAPQRLMDLRSNTGATKGARLGAGKAVDLRVRGRAGVPSDALAVVLNVTSVAPTARTNVRVYPTPTDGSGPPNVSNLNVVPGRSQPNLVTVPIGTDGSVRFWNSAGGTWLLADIAGYFSATGDHGFVPVAPTRLADSRRGQGLAGQLQPGASADLQVSGRGGVPADATAAVVNVTGVLATSTTDVRVYPSPATGSAVPVVSNLNLVPGRNEANLAVVALGSGGQVRFYSSRSPVDLVVDVAGYFRR